MSRSAQQNWLMDSANWSMRSAWKGSSYQHLSTGVRRARGDMIEVFKHFNSYDQALIPCIFKQQQYGIRNNGCQLVWRVPKDGLRGLQTNSFYYRVIKAWNELPSEVVNAPIILPLLMRSEQGWIVRGRTCHQNTYQSQSRAVLRDGLLPGICTTWLLLL